MPNNTDYSKSKRSQRSLIGLVAVALSVVLVAGACSSDDDDAGSDVSVAPTTTAAPTTQAPATTEAPDVMSPPEPEPEPAPTSIASTSSAPGNLVLPDPLPEGDPGELIDVEELGTYSDVKLHRILYHSRNRLGDDIAVSGFVLVPPGDAPEGGWPVLAYAHGTTGSADQCAPSATVDEDLENFGSLEGGSWLRLARQGYVFVATDYQGLGTPGLHTYIVGEDSANTLIDSVRAVINMEQIDASDSWALLGISQGGHAVIHAAQRAPEYAPELDLVGTISMAPPSQFSFLYDVLVVSDARGYLFMAMAAFDEVYEEADVSDVLTPQGMELLDELENGCTDYFFGQTNQYEVDELVAVDNPLAVSPWDDIARENDVNQTVVGTPLFLAHGGADDLIPAASSSFLLTQLCQFPGTGPIIRTEYPGADHGGVVDAAADDVIEWLAARFAGETPPNDCG